MLTELSQLLGAAAGEVRIVDIDGDAALEARYGQRVPVLMIDDDFVCAYRLDPERIRAHLR
jgi:hypothetical protein